MLALSNAFAVRINAPVGGAAVIVKDVEPAASIQINQGQATTNVARAHSTDGAAIVARLVWSDTNTDRSIAGVTVQTVLVSGSVYRADLIADLTAVTGTYTDVGIEWSYA